MVAPCRAVATLAWPYTARACLATVENGAESTWPAGGSSAESSDRDHFGGECRPQCQGVLLGRLGRHSIVSRPRAQPTARSPTLARSSSPVPETSTAGGRAPRERHDDEEHGPLVGMREAGPSCRLDQGRDGMTELGDDQGLGDGPGESAGIAYLAASGRAESARRREWCEHGLSGEAPAGTWPGPRAGLDLSAARACGQSTFRPPGWGRRR
jgi:hypothetical protein